MRHEKCAKVLFVSLGGTLFNGHFEPKVGAAQITELLRSDLDDALTAKSLEDGKID